MIIKNTHYDVIIVGGGLQACLLAHALRHYQPDKSLLLLEKNSQIAGNHTWSYHASDVPQTASDWTRELPGQTWSNYRVLFPGFERRLQSTYCSVSSLSMSRSVIDLANASISTQPNHQHRFTVRTGTEVSRLGIDHVATTDGHQWSAGLVIDCRGISTKQQNTGCGFQKFYGVEIETQSDWTDSSPTLMNARLDQRDGFHFMYVLPFNRRRVLIEDTFFSDSPGLGHAESFYRMCRYLAERGHRKFEIVRKEKGCLPMPWSRQSRPRPPKSSVLQGGYRGGWFHAATGYSFPMAIRFAEAVANGPLQEARHRVNALAVENQFQANWSRTLNRLLFRLVKPEYRWQIFRRFYRVLPQYSIERFYAHRFTKTDLIRILVGRPPRGLQPVQLFNSWRKIPCPLP